MFFFFLLYLLAACKILVVSCGFYSLTRDPTQAPCIRRMGAQPLDHQEVPIMLLLLLESEREH